MPPDEPQPPKKPVQPPPLFRPNFRQRTLTRRKKPKATSRTVSGTAGEVVPEPDVDVQPMVARAIAPAAPATPAADVIRHRGFLTTQCRPTSTRRYFSADSRLAFSAGLGQMSAGGFSSKNVR